MIAAVLGAENQSGDFEVVDMCFSGMPPQPTTATNGSTSEDKSADSDPWIALASGLELGTNEQAADYRAGLLAEWLLGEMGSDQVGSIDLSPKHIVESPAQDRKQASQVTKLILAGNSMKQPVRSGSVDTAASGVGQDRKPRKTYGYDSSTYSSAPTAQLDNFLTEVLESMDVDLMCGEKDPAGITLPQQALHEALLPTAGNFEGFRRVTNPYWFELAGKRYVASTCSVEIDLILRLQAFWAYPGRI